MATTRKYGWDYWGWNGGDSYFAYIRLRHPSDMETINSRIDQMLENIFRRKIRIRIILGRFA